MIRFDVLTLFPDMIRAVLNESIIGRAIANQLIELNIVNIRDFSLNKHKKADDYPYGGGSGMVMLAQPIYDAYKSLTDVLDYKPKVIFMSPLGRKFDQEIAEELKNEKHIILLCGHYEGIDERILEEIVDDEISAGDYILTGGELPAMILIDCVSRLVPGVLSNENSNVEETFHNGLLEYPQYTRPYQFLNRIVPEVLISGHHVNIRRWRQGQSLLRTYRKRPDLYKSKPKTQAEENLLIEFLLKDEV